MQRSKHETGFTLVELLVVIIIIGILAAVAIPAFMNQRQRATDSATISDVKNLAIQITDTLVSCPDADIVEIVHGDLSDPGFMGHKQSLKYDYWLANKSDLYIMTFSSPLGKFSRM